MDFNLAKLIEVLAEHAPNEAVGLFIATYGVFIIAFILIVVVLVRFIKKTGNNKTATEKEVEILKESIKAITEQAAGISLNNANVSQEIKDEIKANNDATMQLLIAMAITSGMNYTDIANVIDKAKSIYSVASDQYDALQQEATAKVEEKEQAEAVAQAQKEQLKADLASIKIGA